MSLRSLRTAGLGAVAALIPVLPPKCSFVLESEVTPTGGVKATLRAWKNTETLYIHVIIPPGGGGQPYTYNGKTVPIPANPPTAQGNMEFTFYHKDPVILQLPSDWNLTSATVTTPLGSGNAVLTYGPWVADITVNAATGVISPAAYYQAEANHQLVMGDWPDALTADGPNSGSVTIEAPGSCPSCQRVDRIKWINCIRAVAVSWTGDTYEYFCPLEPFVSDFAQIQDEAHSLTVDLRPPACALSSGRRPRMEVVQAQVAINTTRSVPASGLDSGPFWFLWSDAELRTPVQAGTPGCYLRIDNTSPAFTSVAATADASGNGSFSLSVPNDPSLIGLGFSLQPVQYDTTLNDLVYGSHGKLVIEAN